jgi:hypothetical protein
MSLPQRLYEHGDEQGQWGGVEMSRDRCIELVIPAAPELWGLARMAVASVASKLGFDLEEIEDLRLAVDELCITCALGGSPRSVLRLACYWSDAGLYLECAVTPVEQAGGMKDGEAKGFSQEELSRNILAALVDAHGISPAGDGTRTGWLRKAGSPVR